MLVTHSVCAGACWYGSSPGAVPATGTATGWAAHPTQRKTQRTKGMTYHNTLTQKHANAESRHSGINTLLMSMNRPINTAHKNTHRQTRIMTHRHRFTIAPSILIHVNERPFTSSLPPLFLFKWLFGWKNTLTPHCLIILCILYKLVDN